MIEIIGFTSENATNYLLKFPTKIDREIKHPLSEASFDSKR